MHPIAPAVAEIISIGDEMTSGARLDTNSQWLSQQLALLGIRTLFHTTVSDSLEACTQAFQIASQRVSIVIVTGGLGPTQDDLTRQAIALAAGLELEFRSEAMEHIEKLFAIRNRPMPPSNRIQAMFPTGSSIIPNPHGTAPGIDLIVTNPNQSLTRFFALPGVPAELEQMWDLTVRSALLDYLNIRQSFCSAVIKCFGVGESDMESLLGNMISRDHVPQVGITVNRATISLRIEAAAATALEASEQVARTRLEILQRAGQYVFGEGDYFELQHAVVAALLLRHQSLCVLEVGNASLLSSWLAETEAPQTFVGGLSFPNWQAATSYFGNATASSNASVGLHFDYAQCVSQLRSQLNANWCLIVNGYPSLRGASQGPLPVANIEIVIGTPDGQLQISQQQLAGHPEVIQPRIAKAALFELLKAL